MITPAAIHLFHKTCNNRHELKRLKKDLKNAVAKEISSMLSLIQKDKKAYDFAKEAYS